MTRNIKDLFCPSEIQLALLVAGYKEFIRGVCGGGGGWWGGGEFVES